MKTKPSRDVATEDDAVTCQRAWLAQDIRYTHEFLSRNAQFRGERFDHVVVGHKPNAWWRRIFRMGPTEMRATVYGWILRRSDATDELGEVRDDAAMRDFILTGDGRMVIAELQESTGVTTLYEQAAETISTPGAYRTNLAYMMRKYISS